MEVLEPAHVDSPGSPTSPALVDQPSLEGKTRPLEKCKDGEHGEGEERVKMWGERGGGLGTWGIGLQWGGSYGVVGEEGWGLRG